nr:unnamed protein product [Callosobruchus chinensis]
MNDYRASSPSQTSQMLSEDPDVSPYREKAVLTKPIINYRNNNENNFVGGYVPVDTTKPKYRGRKTFAFWTLLTLLFILVIGNLMLTLTIIGVLRLGHGMQNIDLVPDHESIKFSGEVDLDHIYKRDGRIEGFQDKPVEILARNSPILLNLSKNGRSVNKAKVDLNETTFRFVNYFQVIDNENNTVFTVTEPTYESLKNVGNFKTKHIQTNRIRSQIDDELRINAEVVNVRGAEGTKIEGKEIIWNADQDIYLKSINGSIVLSGSDGIYLDFKRIPVAKLGPNTYATSQFKLCVCMPEGKLFRIPVANVNEKVYCHHVSMMQNPCSRYY